MHSSFIMKRASFMNLLVFGIMVSFIHQALHIFHHPLHINGNKNAQMIVANIAMDQDFRGSTSINNHFFIRREITKEQAEKLSQDCIKDLK